MKTLLKFGLAAAVSYLIIDAILKRTDQGAADQAVDAANPPSSIDEIPTLRAGRDDDANAAQNAPS